MSKPNRAAFARAILLIALLLGGCAAQDSRGDAPLDSEAQAQTPCITGSHYASISDQDRNYKIQPGDDLAISFYLNSEFDTDVTVRPDGKIGLKLVGDQQARGLTPAELSAELDKAYSNELRDPGVSVLVKSSPSRVVYVQGQVDHPGAVPLQPDMTALAAIAQAGGLSDGANPDAIILIRRDMCGQPHGEELRLGAVLGHKTETPGQEDVELLPGDLLVVPRSKISNIGLFVKQYVKDLIPIQPYLPIL
jgi:protein involved in polysaccharide export with SLBB domain